MSRQGKVVEKFLATPMGAIVKPVPEAPDVRDGRADATLYTLDQLQQKLRTTEMTQSWIIGAMSGAVFVFVAVLLLQL